MRYASPEAFRTALDQRLKTEAAKSGVALMRLRKMVAFDRFLARLVDVAPGRWVLKGALALDLRLASVTRTTKDIDLGRLDDEEAATEDFLAVQAVDLGDFFTFSVRRTPALDAAADFSAVRYRVRAELAGRLFEEFPVDVAFSDPVRWLPDRLAGTELLAFAGIERVVVPGLAIEQHVAEKLHAYTRSFGKDGRPSTRPKDLVDIVLVKRATTLDGRALRAALQATFTARALQSLPAAVPPPPSAWSIPYARLAETVGLPPELERGHREAAELLDPVLSGPGLEIWDPCAGGWSPPLAPASGRPQISASAEGITIGALRNVASDVQPIRVRTLHVPVMNRGEQVAIDVRAEATSAGHGPLTARAPKALEAGASSTVELTLAAPVDQTIAAGDRFEIDLGYRSVAEQDWHLSFIASYDGTSWRIEGANESPHR